MRDFTHKGWLWLCPIYINVDENVVDARHWCLAPLYWLGWVLEAVRIFLCSVFIRGYEPEFLFLLSGELHKPEK